MNKRLYKTDKYGIRNYSILALGAAGVGLLYSVIAMLALVLLHFENGASNSNINSYVDAFWTLQMSASTIGFGDHYPVTIGGRTVVALMFYVGVGLVGFIGALIAERMLGFADTNVKNRELRHQNTEILAHNKQLEEKIDQLLVRVEQALDK
ncbi:MAG: two pore domain potassium channel family protein [Oceanospirillaceae bacterium]|jgi:voltage-gated potassium channel|nr:two pore domain potassium channel family protein [Oceanospirillaceae bacterium]MBT4443297.1 two pore domain potassium channel family protein [Oceanospirillaceae bacterium]MBT6077468.1 two pore domain potassium channel family protein [Oceanospirillaceae bacterium]MBT7331591.1 two pore domain potassium channel family protein [Oceanospirillaceae bacterium]